MQNKFIILCCILGLLGSTVIAKTPNNCKQTVSGDNSNAVCAGHDVIINNNKGLTKDQFEKMLKAREDRLIQRIQSANTPPKYKKQQQLLAIELKAVQEKLVNVEASYKEEKKKRESADKALQQFKDQLPKAQIEKARSSLQQGDTQVAEKAFDDIVKKGSGAIALAAFQSGQLAKNRVDYAKAMKQYKKAVVLEENNPEYLLVAGQMARTTADYIQAQEWLEQLLKIRKTESKKSIDLTDAQNELANIYRFQGKYEAAEPLYKRSLTIKEKALGKDHLLVGTESLD
ncbi:MAG: hypothetical protein DSZ29_06550, partial [Aquificaceae bacterium]